MFANIESRFRRLRRKISRSEWAIRHLGLTPSEGTSEKPGLLLIQIDGLARRQLEAAITRGRMPFLGRLVKRSHYALHTFYPGFPSTTPAVQGELYYGVKSIVPAFAFLDREKQEVGMMFYPEWAKKFEALLQAKSPGEGLLKGGSSWSNIYTGGAAPEEAHFCGASNGFGDLWRTGKIRNIFLFIVVQIPAVLRIIGLILLEFFIAIPEAVRGIWRGQWFSREFVAVLSRTFIGIGLRELLTVSGKIEVARGLPVVHLNFLGYDELAHLRGPGSAFAHWSLLGIDRAIRQLYHAAHRSNRRDYQVWIFSDHGQERTRSFATEFPGGIEQIIARCLDTPRAAGWRARTQSISHTPGRGHRGRQRLAVERTLTDLERTTFSVVAFGPVGHVYFSAPMPDPQKRELARRLVTDGGVPGVLHRTADGVITWHHADGETPVPDGVPGLLASHPGLLAAEIGRDLVPFFENPNTGDLVLLGWGKDGAWSFAPERGAHAGPGLDETQGFLLTPPNTRLPAGADQFVRPSGLREAALEATGRASLIRRYQPARDKAAHVRVMTYNVHNCSGTDGRVSPRRIARIIAQQAPDLVAVQELDHGRARSRSEDQASLIAEVLGYHVVFCPTVVHGDERYGHALFSRWPLTVVKIDVLPADPKTWFPEARYALWARAIIGEHTVNIFTTHFGLSARERLAQMRVLLGPAWIEPVLKAEPVILCGDLNLTPGSASYGLAASRMHDVQAARRGHRPENTFSTTHPFVRIDHIFTSDHFETLASRLPRTPLTRVASDHFPLVAELSFAAVGAGTTTHT